MRTTLLFRLIVLALALLAGRTAGADPIDYRRGMITGADIFGVAAQGLPIGTPVWDWIEDKEYTYQVVMSNNEEDESYVGFGPTRDYGFSSASVTAAGDLEVGVTNTLRRLNGQRAVSRFNLSIKNNLDQPYNAGMDFHIDRGLLEVNGIRSDHTAHLVVAAMIDYVLLTPAGPFGGHYDETSGNLFTYYAELGFDSRLRHSQNVTATLVERSDFVLSYILDPFNGYVSFPEVPPHGELHIFYDMYAHMNIQRFEVGGSAMLGDPLDVTAGPGIRIRPATPQQVPEPTALALLGAGVVTLNTWRRRRRSR